MEEDLLKEFLVETYENLDKLDSDLITLEKKPDSRDVLDNIFRVFHSCKGACGFLGFSKLESVAHAGENLLSSMRDGVIKLNADITGALLSLVDIIRKILSTIEATQKEGDIDCSYIIKNLNNLNSSRSTPEKAKIFETEKKEAAEPAKYVDENDVTIQINKFSFEEKEEFERLVGEAIDLNGAIVSTDLEAIVAKCKQIPSSSGGPMNNAIADTVKEISEKTPVPSQISNLSEKKTEAIAADVK
ncbi:MAG TPA: Hpt domain-containing protein, partial [Candidatus Wallbacteria bacterium]|nr:Hpt domain-containing protein [Candidatus Wallbacteria bacterium]